MAGFTGRKKGQDRKKALKKHHSLAKSRFQFQSIALLLKSCPDTQSGPW